MGIRKRAALWLVNGLLAGPRFFEAKASLLRWAGMTIGKGTKVVGPIFCTGELTVGKDSWIGRNLTVHGDGLVRIGDGCDLGPDVTFLTGGHALGSPERRAGPGESYTISIEDGCWIGARATLLGNVTLGPGSVLAACGCAVSDVEANTLVGGVPARPIRRL